MDGLVGRLLVALIAIRVVAAVLLIAGPWTDDGTELAGWDVERFQEIADAEGRHWVDHEVEYPPGSVVAIEALALTDVVGTHRTLAVLSLAVEVAIAVLLAKVATMRAAAAYLILGLPLVPMGLVRFDLLSILLALGAAVALARTGPDSNRALLADRPSNPTRFGRAAMGFGILVVAGALVKIWPALLLGAAVALRRWSATVAAIVLAGAAGLGWLAYSGWSLDAIDQVVALRGATGWHVESLGGTLSALLTDSQPERQLNAFRIGELNDGLVAIGRLVTIAAVLWLGYVLSRARRADEVDAGRVARAAELRQIALFMLGSTAALLVTAPLLSPQFLLWLTPWAGLVVGFDRGRASAERLPLVAILTGGATLLTGIVLSAWGPPNVGQTVPALLLLGRNLLLVAIVIASGAALRRSAAPQR